MSSENNNSKPRTPCGFIDDGYTMDFDIPEVPGVSIGLSGTYRPMTQRERKVFFGALDPSRYEVNINGSAVNRVAKPSRPIEDILDEKQCEAVVKHLKTWNLVNREGESVELTAANVGRLYPSQLQGALVDVICGLYGDNQIAFNLTAVAMDREKPVAERLAAIEVLLNKVGTTTDETTDNEKN